MARRAVAPLAALLLVALAACGTPTSAAGPGADTDSDTTHGRHQPIPTTEADWKPVTDALGRTGKFGDGNTVYRIPLPRNDLRVTSGGVAIKPGLSLGGYAAFAKYHDGVMLMGDLVVTEAELPKVTDALQAHGIEQTALHKHLLQQDPPIWWTHIHAMGDNPAALAQGVKAALDATAIPPAAAPPGQQPPVDLDTAGIDKVLGRKGTADGGLYKFTVARKETITDDGHVLPPTFGVTTGINFQPVGGGKAAINGDFVMTAPEVQQVIQALRKGGISLVEVHNHSFTEQPRLFYAHFSTPTSGPSTTVSRWPRRCGPRWTPPISNPPADLTVPAAAARATAGTGQSPRYQLRSAVRNLRANRPHRTGRHPYGTPRKARRVLTPLSYPELLGGATMTAVLEVLLMLAVPKWRRPGLIATTAAIGFLVPAGWQIVLKLTHSYEFYTDLPLKIFPISWQDTGSGIATYTVRSLLLTFGPMRNQPARDVANLSMATGAVALLVDIYLY
ncbi:DUF1259 domain-containing protein [Prauserella flavalba]|uniref:DUF1259 domain-containing protein n=1 Tax=Prauserella flavalba TaxID=1477506 RepID=UPI001AEF52CC|nr:DUF1259 domain-containing protein [Prauserella flavalba]